MKLTKATLVFIALVAIISIQAKAQNESINIVPISKNIYQLTYLKKCPCKVEVEVTDAQGKNLLTETIQSKKAFTKPFNFVNLKGGAFEFKLTDLEGEYTAQIQRGDEVNMTAGIVKLSEDKAKLVVKGDVMAPVYVNIYDKYNLLVFEDYIDHEKGFSRIYDLSKVRSDDLRIEVITNNKTLATARY